MLQRLHFFPLLLGMMLAIPFGWVLEYAVLGLFKATIFYSILPDLGRCGAILSAGLFPVAFLWLRTQMHAGTALHFQLLYAVALSAAASVGGLLGAAIDYHWIQAILRHTPL